MPEIRLVPATVKLRDADGVPYTVVSGDKLPAVVMTGSDGLTIMLKVTEVPVHVALAGKIVMIAVTALCPLLTAVNEGMLPVPLAGRPMPGASFVQV
jgi:hypothetical protein